MAKAQQVNEPADLLKVAGIHHALLTASGISDKAAGHMDQTVQNESIQALIKTYLEPAGASFREELVYRFLLTRGDTLGGAMRNVVGAIAQRRFTSMLLARLHNSGISYFYRIADSAAWTPHTEEATPAMLEIIKFVSWRNNSGWRVMAYNQKVPIVDKNIDMNLLACSPEDFSRATLSDPANFLALGELKGGIDPAGADEHWKTADSALKRIRDAFAARKRSPSLFFIGAAIEQAMANEVWKHLKAGSLANAANLTVDRQLTALCDWLVSL